MKTKEMKGITLVALVVTIVVLLILAGVSINLVLGNNGIIAKAKDAETKSAEASQNDLIGMNELAQQLEEQINGIFHDNYLIFFLNQKKVTLMLKEDMITMKKMITTMLLQHQTMI